MRTTAKLLLMMGSTVAALLPAVPAQAAEATISNFSFSPNPVTIPLGATLQWTNADSAAHTITADDDSFSSGSLATQAKFSHTFNQPGPVAYHCEIHSNMRGTVQVEGATTTTAAPTTTTTAAPTTTTTAAPTTTTRPKPAVSSTTRATAAPTTATTAAVTTTAPPATTTAPPAAAPEETTATTEAALDMAADEGGSNGSGPMAVGVAAVLLALGGGAGWWALRRRSATRGV